MSSRRETGALTVSITTENIAATRSGVPGYILLTASWHQAPTWFARLLCFSSVEDAVMVFLI